MKDTTNQIGAFVKAERRRLGMIQAKLAKAAGLHQSVLSRIESGEINKPTVETLDKLAKALDIPFPNLLHLVQERPPEPVNFHPFVLALASTLTNETETRLSLEDLEFLIKIQQMLRTSLTPSLIKEFLRARKEEVSVPIDFAI